MPSVVGSSPCCRLLGLLIQATTASAPLISVASLYSASWDVQRDIAVDRDRFRITQSFCTVSVDLTPITMLSLISDSLHDELKLQE